MSNPVGGHGSGAVFSAFISTYLLPLGFQTTGGVTSKTAHARLMIHLREPKRIQKGNTCQGKNTPHPKQIRAGFLLCK